MSHWLDRLKGALDLSAGGAEHVLDAMFEAVGAAKDALRECADARPYLDCLIALQVELDRLRNGRRSRILRPMGRVKPDGYLGMVQGHAICMSDALFLAFGGKRGARRRADVEAAAMLGSRGLRGFASNTITGDMVRQWRSQSIARHAPQVVEFRREIQMREFQDGELLALANELAAKAATHPGREVS
jgi:hypothetical protein